MQRTSHDLREPRTLHDSWARIKTGAFALAFAILGYFAVVMIPTGLFTYLLSLPAAAIVLLTAWKRIDVLGIELASTKWNVRRSGLIFAAIFALAVFAWPWLHDGEWTPWAVVIGIWGFAKTWLTTRHEPPWKDFVFGKAPPEPKTEHRRHTDDFDSNP